MRATDEHDTKMPVQKCTVAVVTPTIGRCMKSYLFLVRMYVYVFTEISTPINVHNENVSTLVNIIVFVLVVAIVVQFAMGKRFIHLDFIVETTRCYLYALRII